MPERRRRFRSIVSSTSRWIADARISPDLPAALRKPNVLSAIFRVGADNRATGAPCEYALRLLVEPARQVAPVAAPESTDWAVQGPQPLTA